MTPHHRLAASASPRIVIFIIPSRTALSRALAARGGFARARQTRAPARPIPARAVRAPIGRHRTLALVESSARDDMSTLRARRAATPEVVDDAETTKSRATRARGPFRLPKADEDDDGKKCSAWFCAVCDVDDAPEWMVWNPYVRSGYRVGARWLGATRSIFMLHNETVNIWSHLLGVLMFAALIVQTFRTAHSGVGLAAPPAHWVTGADVARVERIQYATRWRQEIRRDRDDLRAIDVALHERLQNGSAARDILRGVRDDLLDVTHELAEHLESGEEVFKVEKRRKVLKRSLKGAQKVLEAMDRAGGKDYEEISVQTEALRKKLSQLKKHIKFVPDDPEPARPVTRWPMYIFLTGAVVCLFFSTMCHTYCCVGEIDAERMWRFDYLGIAVLIVASFYPMLHYSYYCLPGWRDMYLTGITVFGCLTVVPTFMRAFQKKEYAPLRASLFVALGCLGLFPIFQQVFFVWHIVPTPMMEAFYFEMAMGFGYVFGAFLYAKMIPERWSPGSFDFFGCSHNIFHFLIVLSTYFHYRASIIYLTWRDNYTCDADHELLLEWYHLGHHFRYPTD